MLASPLLHSVPKLKLGRMQEPLHLGDSMKITGLHESGFLAQLNGSIEVLLIPGYDRSPSSDEEDDDDDDSPPQSHRSLPPSSKKSPITPSRSHSQPSPSRAYFEGLVVDRLSPRAASSPSLPITTLCPRTRAKTLSVKQSPSSDNYTLTTSPVSPRTRSTPTSPRSSPVLGASPYHPASRTKEIKPMQRSPSYGYIPLQGWVLWRKSIGQWERIWLASKKSPNRICFFTSENEDSEETDSVRIETIKSIWAPSEEENKKKLSPSVHFRLFTDKKTIYLIVQTPEKMKYWVTGLKKLIPDLEIDMREKADPASPISPRQQLTKTKYILTDTNESLNGDSYSTEDDTEDEWAL